MRKSAICSPSSLAIALAGAVGAVILIEDGWIDEQGSHEALMAQNGKYAQMYRMQSGLADE